MEGYEVADPLHGLEEVHGVCMAANMALVSATCELTTCETYLDVATTDTVLRFGGMDSTVVEVHGTKAAVVPGSLGSHMIKSSVKASVDVTSEYSKTR